MKRFIDIYVPVTSCTLRCHYCYITHHRLFDTHLPVFKYSAQQIGEALSAKRLGGICHFNMCGGGETLLPPEMTAITRAILEQGHYVMIVTNGTVTKRFEEMIAFPAELRKRLGFKFSFHYLELKKRNLLESFFANIERVRNARCSFSLELTPSDELIPYIDEIKAMCMEKVGALCHVTVARDEKNPEFPILTQYSREEYKKIWGVFHSDLFDFKMSVFGEKRKEFCYTGAWGGLLDLGSGILIACNHTLLRQNIFSDLHKPIKVGAIGRCNLAHCHNAHAWLTLGMVPSLCTPYYAQMRDRTDKDGNGWLTPEMSAFLSQKLQDANDRYSPLKENLLVPCKKGANWVWDVGAFIKNKLF